MSDAVGPTEGQRAEDALGESEELIRTPLSATGQGAYGANLEGNCTYANPSSMCMLGYEKALPALFSSTSLPCLVGDSHNTEVVGCALQGSIPENIAAPHDLKINESSLRHLMRQLCFQQSSGNSTGPQIDISSGAIRDGLLNQDIGDLDPSARL